MRLFSRLLRAAIALSLLTPATSAFALDAAYRVDALSFSDASHGVLGGTATTTGFASTTSDGGKTWSSSRIGNNTVPGATASGSGGFAVKDYGGQVWGSTGGSWTLQGLTGGDNVKLNDIAVLANGRLAAVGAENFHGVSASIRISDDDGQTWTPAFRGPTYQAADESLPDPSTNAEMWAIDAAGSGQTAWAIGNEWNPGSAAFKRALVYRTADGGSTWATSTPLPATNGNTLYDLAAVDANTMFAIGPNRTLVKTTNAGGTWTLAVIPFVASGTVSGYSIDALDASRILIGANLGRIGWSTNGGTSFTYYTVPGSPIIRDVRMVTDTFWIAAGDNETIYRTEDGGTTWTGTTGTKAPTVSVLSPVSSGTLPGPTATVSGTASDGAGVGVSAVELSIRSEDGLYFNGIGWQAGQAWVLATNDGAWKTWHADIPLGVHAGQGFDITARATDGQGLTGFSAVSGVVHESQRLSAGSRYSGAVAVARDTYDTDAVASGTQWDVTDIVIASGEDRAGADPLAAAGLCGVYDAPLFLVTAASVDSSVKNAVKEIAAAATGPVKVHIVGGTASVPDARYNDLVTAIGSSAELSKDRILASGNRYDLAAAIARRMRSVTGTTPSTVLIANGADPAKFFDALALSPISAHNAYPILLVSATSVPTATQRLIDEFKPAKRIIGGGPATVSDTVRTKLAATRWSGATRYTTATTIADKGVAEANMSRSTVGVASTLPYALIGGAAVGARGGVLVITDGTTLTSSTGNWLSANKAQIGRCILFGDTSSPTGIVKTAIDARLQ